VKYTASNAKAQKQITKLQSSDTENNRVTGRAMTTAYVTLCYVCCGMTALGIGLVSHSPTVCGTSIRYQLIAVMGMYLTNAF